MTKKELIEALGVQFCRSCSMPDITGCKSMNLKSNICPRKMDRASIHADWYKCSGMDCDVVKRFMGRIAKSMSEIEIVAELNVPEDAERISKEQFVDYFKDAHEGCETFYKKTDFLDAIKQENLFSLRKVLYLDESTVVSVYKNIATKEYEPLKVLMYCLKKPSNGKN